MTTTPANTGPLSDLRVIEMGTLLAGPFCGQLMGDFGAEVIKVEPPNQGDPMRDWGQEKAHGKSLWWPVIARNKKSVTLNLREKEGQEIVYELVRNTDFLLENFRPGTMERWGLGYEELKKINPRLIMIRVSGYGQSGPYSKRAGFGAIGEAMGGLRYVCGDPSTPPSRMGVSIGDSLAATFACLGALTALHHRERTGEGQVVQTSLLANGLWSVAGIAQGAMAGGDMDGYRETNQIYGPTLRPYETADGRWLQFNMIRSEELLTELLIAFDAVELLADPRFGDLPTMLGAARQAFGDELQRIVRTRSAAEWMEIVTAHDLPINLVADVEETVADEQIRINAMAIEPPQGELETPLIIKNPITVTSAPHVEPRRAPSLGEHGREILAELGYSSESIDELVARSVI